MGKQFTEKGKQGRDVALANGEIPERRRMIILKEGSAYIERKVKEMKQGSCFLNNNLS